MATELPLRLDTIIVLPDEQKVNLVWRAMIIGNYEPNDVTLMLLTSEQKQALLQPPMAH